MSKTPIILKKDNSQRKETQSQQVQPKILIKSNRENVQNQQSAPTSSNSIQQAQVATKKPAEPIHHEPQPPPQMTHSIKFMRPHFQLDDKILELIDNENTDFAVVAIIGRRSVGKTTLVNFIANPSFIEISDNNTKLNFLDKKEVFQTKPIKFEGATIDGFITSNRIFILDTSPVATNIQRRDMIVAESDDLKLLSTLIQCCHLIFAVHDGGFPDLSLQRLVNCALEITPKTKKHRANIVYIANRVEPGTRPLLIDEKIHSGVQMSIPDFSVPNVSLYHDIPQIIQDFQEKAFMMKRYSMLDSDAEVFTEKKWCERIFKVVDGLRNDYFLRKYDNLRDKYHQPVDN